MSAFYRLDADLNGTDSIAPYIKSATNPNGKITNLACSTFEEFDKHRVELQKSIVPGDIICLDTMSTMLTTTRADRQVGNKIDEPLWEPNKIKKYFGDKEYLAVYNMATQLTIRALKNLRARGAQIICLCHEDEVMDAMAGMKMAGPQVNPAMVGELVAASSDVFRLVNLTAPILNPDGSTKVPTGERILYLRRTDAYTAKFHVARERSEKIPSGIINPTIAKLCEVLGKQPSWLTIYGHPGAGKTSLAATATDV